MSHYKKRPQKSKKQKKSAYHGWIAIDKPHGMGSTDVVNRVKWLLKELPSPSGRGVGGEGSEAMETSNVTPTSPKALTPVTRVSVARSQWEREKKGEREKAVYVKIGHAGTLDPLATGVLMLALGEATKMVEYVMDSPKAYKFEVTWGQERTTDDMEGEIVETSDKRPDEAAIRNVMTEFEGVIQQVPPTYSAIKVDGQRAYDLARAGQKFELEARPVIVHSIECTRVEADKAEFEVLCGKGTYVRSIARDIGRKLGCYGYISALVRTKNGKCVLTDTISLAKLEEIVHKTPPTEWLKPVDFMLDDIPAWDIHPGGAKILRHGNTLKLLPNRYPEFMDDMEDGELIAAYDEGKLLALAELDGDEVKPVRVFQIL